MLLLLAFTLLLSLVDGPAALPDTTLLDADADSAEVLIARGRWEAEGAGDSGVGS
jgi:hypothetical protein